MNSDAQYPLPIPTVFTKAFWDACQRKILEVPRCTSCGKLFFPGGPVCPYCLCDELATQKLSGLGRVFSFVIYHRTYHPAIPAPYVVALIELTEGVRLVTNIIDCCPQDISIGMEVQVVFKQESGFMLPYFRPFEPMGESSHE